MSVLTLSGFKTLIGDVFPRLSLRSNPWAGISQRLRRFSKLGLAKWFEEFHAQVWDQQIERDLKARRLDSLLEQAKQDLESIAVTEPGT